MRNTPLIFALLVLFGTFIFGLTVTFQEAQATQQNVILPQQMSTVPIANTSGRVACLLPKLHNVLTDLDNTIATIDEKIKNGQADLDFYRGLKERSICIDRITGEDKCEGAQLILDAIQIINNEIRTKRVEAEKALIDAEAATSLQEKLKNIFSALSSISKGIDLVDDVLAVIPNICPGGSGICDAAQASIRENRDKTLLSFNDAAKYYTDTTSVSVLAPSSDEKCENACPAGQVQKPSPDCKCTAEKKKLQLITFRTLADFCQSTITSSGGAICEKLRDVNATLPVLGKTLASECPTNTCNPPARCSKPFGCPIALESCPKDSCTPPPGCQMPPNCPKKSPSACPKNSCNPPAGCNKAANCPQTLAGCPLNSCTPPAGCLVPPSCPKPPAEGCPENTCDVPPGCNKPAACEFITGLQCPIDTCTPPSYCPMPIGCQVVSADQCPTDSCDPPPGCNQAPGCEGPAQSSFGWGTPFGCPMDSCTPPYGCPVSLSCPQQETCLVGTCDQPAGCPLPPECPGTCKSMGRWCASDASCCSGSCMISPSTGTGTCVSCLFDSDCPEDAMCTGGSCRTDSPPPLVVKEKETEAIDPIVFQFVGKSKWKTDTTGECIRGSLCTSSIGCCGAPCSDGYCLCSVNACSASGECCTGYCEDGKCKKAPTMSAFFFSEPAQGCAGLIDECLPGEGNCISVCGGLTMLLLISAVGSGLVAWNRFNRLLPGVAAAILPSFLGILLYTFVGIITALIIIAMISQLRRRVKVITMPLGQSKKEENKKKRIE